MLRHVVRELRRIADATERLAAVHAPLPLAPQAPSDRPPVEVFEVTSHIAAELMAIELRLTQATGAPPDEEQVQQEFDRLYGEGALENATRVSQTQGPQA